MVMKVGNREFKTKKECKQTVRDLIAEIGMTNDVKSEFLYDLIKLHYEYEVKTANMSTLGITFNPLGPGLRLVINNKDGSQVEISWHVALDGQPSIKADQTAALRSCIKNQINNYRKSAAAFGQMLECEFCQTNSNLQVDHIYTFSQIVQDFVAAGHVIPTEFRKIGCELHFLEGEAVEFQEFHQKKATYRMLCQKCNVGRNSKKSSLELHVNSSR
jgi:hypothetical protein